MTTYVPEQLPNTRTKVQRGLLDSVEGCAGAKFCAHAASSHAAGLLVMKRIVRVIIGRLLLPIFCQRVPCCQRSKKERLYLRK